MKILYFWGIIGLTIISICSCSSKSDNVSNAKFQCSIEKGYTVTDSFGEIQKTLEYTAKFYCDQNGDTIKFEMEGKDGKIMICDNSYDVHGHLLEKKINDSDNSFIAVYKASYDEQNRIVSEYEYGCGTKSFMYDEKGNQISCTIYDDEILRSKTTYKYDENNNIISETIYDKSGSVESKTMYSYDMNGNKDNSTIYDSEGEIISKIDFSYDKNNNLIASDKTEYENDFYSHEHHSIDTYTYDKVGNLIRHYCQTGMGSPVFEHLYKYDKENHLLSFTYNVLVEGIESKSVTQYDINGNEVSEARYGSDGVMRYRRVTKYNDKNLPISIETFGKADILDYVIEISYEY